mmetsp:Transcript_159147/g.296603  ORF Transcript_159147/g.296603 Transcript_159147/m.296603 type:complete len:482 (-) Transcript_159147:65-1510(-)
MSWRNESTFKPSSALDDSEKDFLKMAKKLREIFKLEDKAKKGETLEKKQQEKVADKEKMIKDIAAIAGKLPGSTDLLDKNPDILEVLPASLVRGLEKQRRQVQAKEKEEEERRERRLEKEREERSKPIFMKRHDRCILGIAVSQIDGYIFTCSKDKYVNCWSMENPLLECVCTYGGHGGAVFAIDCSEGTPEAPARLISGGADGKVMLWATDVGRRKPKSVASPLTTIDHGGSVRVLRWCPFDAPGGPQRFASASEKLVERPAALVIWSMDARGRVEQRLRIEAQLPGKANDLRWAGGAKLKLLSAHDNGYVGVWLAEGSDPAKALMKTIKLHSAPIASLCLSPDGNAVLTASHDASAKVVDITKPATETLATYKAVRPLNAVATSSDYKPGTEGSLIVAGGRDPMVVTKSVLDEDEFEAKILDSESGEPVYVARGHFGPVHCIYPMHWLDPKGAFATCSEDGCLRVHALDGSTLYADRIE